MADEKILFEVVYDTEQAVKNAGALQAEQIKLREQQKDLQKLYQFGVLSLEEYGKELEANKRALSNNSKEMRQAQKIAETTNGSLNAQRARLAELSKEYGKVDKSTKEGKKRFKELQKEIKGLNDEIKKDEQAVGDFRRGVGDYTNSIIAAISQTRIFGISVGQAAGAIKLASVAANTGVGALRLFKVALASTGIGLLVVVLGTLISYFTNTQRGADLVSKAMAGLGAAVSVIVDRASALGEIFVNVFTGKTGITQAALDAKKALTGVGDEIARETRLLIELKEREIELEKTRIGQIETQAVLRAAYEDTYNESQNVNKSEAERIELTKRAQGIFRNLIQIQRLQLQEEIAITDARLKSNESLRTDADAQAESLEKLANLRADLFNLDATQSRQLRRLTNQENSLTKKILDDQAAAAKKAADERQKTAEEEFKDFKSRNKEIEKVYTRQTETFKQRAKEEQDLLQAGLSRKEELKITQDLIDIKVEGLNKTIELAQEENAIAKQNADNRMAFDRQVAYAKQDLLLDTLGLFRSVTKEESALNKAAAIDQAIASTWAGAAKALELGWPLGAIAAASQIITGLGFVANIVGIKLAEGGFLKLSGGGRLDGIGGYIPDINGSIAVGRDHSRGGIRFGHTEIEGGEIVMTKNVSKNPKLLSAASEINVAAGGRALVPSTHMQDGGISIRSATRSTDNQIAMERAYMRVIKRMPIPIVRVQDIRKETDKAVKVENRGNFG